VAAEFAIAQAGDAVRVWRVQLDNLLPLVYEELRRMARARMGKCADVRTLQPTALVHEVWLRLAAGGGREWQDRNHFLATAALAMRQILIEEARRKGAAKRSGRREDAIDLENIESVESSRQILLINEALEVLESRHPAAGKIVEWKFFGGMGNAEVAKVLGCGLRSVERQWAFARAKLYQIIRDELLK
jgi:RNA polymerase sigma factor (TIGR02999 family)